MRHMLSEPPMRVRSSGLSQNAGFGSAFVVRDIGPGCSLGATWD